jgi:hypothetical protein
VALTDEDKQWIAGQLLTHIDSLKTGQIEHIDSLKTSLIEHIDSLKTSLIEHIDERTHDVETRLLRAFADYNTAADTRFRKLEADASNLNTSSTIRLGELERQMSELQAKVILIEGRLPR